MEDRKTDIEANPNSTSKKYTSNDGAFEFLLGLEDDDRGDGAESCSLVRLSSESSATAAMVSQVAASHRLQGDGCTIMSLAVNV